MSAVEQIDYDLLADKIAQRMVAPPPDAVTWTKQQCAHYFHCNLNHFMTRIAAKTNFPNPCNISGKENGKKLWFAQEVTQWAKENR